LPSIRIVVIESLESRFICLVLYTRKYVKNLKLNKIRLKCKFISKTILTLQNSFPMQILISIQQSDGVICAHDIQRKNQFHFHLITLDIPLSNNLPCTSHIVHMSFFCFCFEEHNVHELAVYKRTSYASHNFTDQTTQFSISFCMYPLPF